MKLFDMFRRGRDLVDRGREAKARVRERIESSPLGDAIFTAAAELVADDGNNLKPADIPKVAEKITNTIARQAPEQANAEPWWQNRVKVGLAIMAIAPAARLLGIDLNLSPEQEADLTIVTMSLGGAVAAFGEWFARRLKAIRWSSPATWIVIVVAVGGAGVAYAVLTL